MNIQIRITNHSTRLTRRRLLSECLQECWHELTDIALNRKRELIDVREGEVNQRMHEEKSMLELEVEAKSYRTRSR